MRVYRASGWLCFCVCALAFAGASVPRVRAEKPAPPSYIHGIYVRASPAPQAVAPSEAAWRAELAAEQIPGARVVVGHGGSMAPLYPDGTVLVVAPRDFAQLTRGMTVLYFNRENRSVAHVLVAKTRDGWRVAGLANPGHDADGVRADNFDGVVAAAFVPRAGSTAPLLAESR